MDSTMTYMLLLTLWLGLVALLILDKIFRKWGAEAADKRGKTQIK